MNKKASFSSLFIKGVIIFSGCAFLSSTPGLTYAAQAQSADQARKKVTVQTTKQLGFRDKSTGSDSKISSMSLNPSLFQRKAPDELMLDSDANLDYRVTQGCLRRSFSEDNLPASVGINNRQFSEFFKAQTKTFFDRMRGECIPYAVAFGARNRFDSLSIMNGPIQDSKTEVWTFTPSAVGGFLIQQDYLKDESKRLTEIRIPLRDVLYDPRKVSDQLPVELVWELNSLIKQIYPEENNSLENTNSVVRLIVDFGDRENWAQIWAVEIIDPATKEVFANAFWLERNDIPGGFFTGSGESLERSFWTNPLSYRRISRGVGMVRAGNSKKSKAPSPVAKAPAADTKQRYRAHMGIDYSAPIGTPVFSVANGKVAHIGYSGAFGNLIVLEHPGNYHTYYAHLSSYNVELELGNEVRRGLEIGYVGSTGRSTGPHLHFELRKNGVYVDPYGSRTLLDLWSMRDNESGQLTREILLLGSPIKQN
ncbi:M23 family metallopeptidase [Polynucleobacter sp. MWH-Braz-FAM2G]|uniref:M23 family metallopeptidase n=1 Tax=Polynucleobacter sp. MWH-Braz-FAM2G TaxID=1855883 RepID=UPI0020416B34|nr:M23 family metallopeptidase [Polynucleobacter sp. MWH-Braz-FAM2G]QWD90340.1 M23 family metallopeptidase [Polynucleobacter sp. MWH-Braz-FAM2G]